MSELRRIAITGSSGYFGRRLLGLLAERLPDVEVLGLDVAPPPTVGPAPRRFTRIDIRDPELAEVLAEFVPDTVVHLAFIVNPMHDERTMHDINIGGSRNLLDAVARVRPARLLVASSATAYGAWPDNPVPIDESWPTRARTEFRYGADKTELDQMVARFADEHPEIAVAWVRPAIIYGPGVDNYLSRFIFRLPVITLVDGVDLPIQFVHEEDVAEASLAILQADGRGPYNLAPPDWLHLTEVAELVGKRAVRVPFRLLWAIQALGWHLHLPTFEAPPGILYFLIHPWVLTPRRLTEELGYRFRHSSRETLLETLAALRARRGR